MRKHKPNDARPGQVVVNIVCCDGGRLVRQDRVDTWRCGRCNGTGRIVAHYKFEADMSLTRLETAKRRDSYR